MEVDQVHGGIGESLRLVRGLVHVLYVVSIKTGKLLQRTSFY